MIDISKIDSLSVRKKATKSKSKKQKIPKGAETMLIAKKKLLEMIELTGKSSSVLPILESVLLERKNGNLCFQWTNLSETVEIKEPIKGNGNCVLAVPKKILKESIQMLKEDEINVDIDSDTGRAKISDGKIESTIKNCFPAEEFPELPKRIESKEEEMEVSVFLEGLKKVLFAQSTDEIRPNLCGVHIEFSQDGLSFTATNGCQLANWNIEGEYTENQFILPTGAVAMLLKLQKKDGNIKIRKNKEYVQFEVDNILETFHLEDLKFPDWEHLLIHLDRIEIALDKKEFTTILKNASKIESAARFIFDNQKLTIETENVDRKVKQKIPLLWGNINVTIGLNCKALDRGIKQIENPELRMWLGKESDSILIKDNNYRYFLMPLRLEE